MYLVKQKSVTDKLYNISDNNVESRNKKLLMILLELDSNYIFISFKIVIFITLTVERKHHRIVSIFADQLAKVKFRKKVYIRKKRMKSIAICIRVSNI